MYNYKTYLILESNRDNKIKKQKDKIRKFLRYEPLINSIFDKVVGNNDTKGLKYVIWFADKLKKYLANNMVQYSNGRDIYFQQLDNEEKLKTITNYLTTGEFKFSKQILNVDGKLDFNEEETQQHEEKMKSRIDDYYKNIFYIRSITEIVDWLKSPLRDEEIVDLSQYDRYFDALRKARDWHKNLKASGVIINEKGNIIMSFPDGYYWIDLGKKECEDEGNAMGHCATTNHDTLYSLRKKQSPHVTVAIEHESDNSAIIYQMKGRGNEKPVEKYHPYIVELLAYPNVSEDVKINKTTNMYQIIDLISNEYKPEKDFHISDLSAKRIKYLFDKNKVLMDKQNNIALKNKLMKEGELTKEEFVDGYSDLKIINDEIHFILSGWSDFDKAIFKDRSYFGAGWQAEVLEYSLIVLHDYDEKFNYDSDWGLVEDIGFETIIEVCDKKKYKIFYNYKGISNEMILSKENMKFNKKKNDIIITTKKKVLSFKKLINTVNFDNLVDIKNKFNNAKSSAKMLVDEDDAFETVTNAIIKKLGPLSKNVFDDGLHFIIDLEYISEVENSSNEQNKRVIDIINTLGYDSEGYGDDESDLLIDCDYPNYDWSGVITPESYTEELINKLDEL